MRARQQLPNLAGAGGRDNALPLGRPRARAPPASGARASGAVAQPSHFSRADIERAREEHQENLKKAQEAAERQRRRDKERPDREKQEQKERMKRVDAEREAARQSRIQADIEARRERDQLASKKRPTPRTSEGSRLAYKRPRVEEAESLLVWSEGGTRASLVERALYAGEPQVAEVDPGIIMACIRDGVAIRASEAGFFQDGLSSDPSMRCDWWKRLVAGIEVKDNKECVAISCDGGTGCTRLGVGTFNAVVSMPKDKLPHWIDEDCALRLTRPDTDSVTKEHKYQGFENTMGEIRNAMFASENLVGPRMHSCAVFSAIREGRSLRFGVVSTMQRATKDLGRALRKMTAFEQGATAAESCVDLLYRVSRLGVAFFDIKPGNVLRFEEGGRVVYKLADFDPAFFLRTQGRDWRALLLLNLTLLSVHVHNSDLGAVGRGWARAVAPALRQLLRRRDEYDGGWLFLARCADVDFDSAKDASDFELQKMLTTMSGSYFYGRHRSDALSYKFAWKGMRDNNAALRAHWACERNKGSWPWKEAAKEPLIEQLVELALSCA